MVTRRRILIPIEEYETPKFKSDEECLKEKVEAIIEKYGKPITIFKSNDKKSFILVYLHDCYQITLDYNYNKHIKSDDFECLNPYEVMVMKRMERKNS